MTLTRAAKLVVRCEQCDERCAAEVELAEGLVTVKLIEEERLHAIDNELNSGKLAILKRQLDEASAWYRSPLFVAAVTAVAVVGGMLGARKLIVEAQ